MMVDVPPPRSLSDSSDASATPTPIPTTAQDDPSSARAEFLNGLFAFMSQRGSPIDRVPVFDHRELDLYQLYRSVTSRGGLSNVIESKLWRQVTGDLGVDQDRTDAGFRLRMHYLRYLFPYERRFFLGLPDNVGSSSSVQQAESPGVVVLGEQTQKRRSRGQRPSSSSPVMPGEEAAATTMQETVLSSPVCPNPTRVTPVLPALKLEPAERKRAKVTRSGSVDLRKLDEATLVRYRQRFMLPAQEEDGGNVVERVREHFETSEVDEPAAIGLFLSALKRRS